MFIKEISFCYDRPANSIRQWSLFALFTVTLTMFIPLTHAQELESISHIETEMQNYLNQQFKSDTNVTYEIGYLDQRVKLDKCTEPLEVFLPVGAKPLGNSSLGVRCQGNKRWKIHVPVKIIRFSNVLTAKRTLIRGNPITIDDVQNSRIDISHISNGYFTDINEISGMVLKQGLSQGQVIRNGMLEIPRLIKRGEMVTILVNTRTIEVRMKGEALMDGRKNEIIQVKNHNSNKVIQAQVVSSGTVQVTM